MRKKAGLLAAIAISAAVLLVLSGCGSPLAPFDAAVVNQKKDETLPVITITSPETDTEYTQTVTVRGEVTDDGGVLPELSYTVSDSLGSTEKYGTVEVSTVESEEGVAGSFTFQFTTSEYSTDILLTVSAKDWNGNVGEAATLRLAYPGSGLSSLEVTPANKQISLSWEKITGADEYTVMYNVDGTTFNESTADFFVISAADYDEISPVILTAAEHGVSNNVICRVKVKATSSDGEEWSSAVIETLPLSQFSLLPKTDCFENKIVLDWRPASNGVNYQVWRSDNGRYGTYELISGSDLNMPTYTDTQVVEGQRYHYRIGTVKNSIQLSAPVDAEITSMRTSGSAEIYRAFASDDIVALDISGTRAYGLTYDTADDVVEVIAVDISSPDFPLEISRVSWTVPGGTSLGSAFDLVVSDNIVFVSVYYWNPTTYKIIAFDISNPESITEITDADISWLSTTMDRLQAMKVDTARDLLYIAVDSDGIACVDISGTPDTWAYVLASGWSAGRAVDVAFSGNYAYAANLGNGITVADFTSKTIPTIGTTVSVDSIAGADVYTAIDADPAEGILVMVSEHDDPDSGYYHGGIWTLDISTPDTPVAGGAVDLEIPFTDVSLDGTHAYCTTGNGGVRMIDVTVPTGVFERIAFDTVGDSDGLGLFSSGIAVADGSGGISIILPPEIEEPAIIDDTFSPSQSSGSFLQDDILYIAARFSLYSTRVESDGTIAGLATNGSADSTDVVVLGDYAFVAVGGLSATQLAVINIADPEDLSEAVFYDCEDIPVSVDYWGDYLYVGEGGAGVEVFDIADPENPVSLGLIPVNRNAEMVSAFRDKLYIADYAYGLLVYDIEDPEDPVFINDFYDSASSERQVYSIDVSGDYVYACMEDYIHILSTNAIPQWETADTSSSDFGAAVGWIDSSSYSPNLCIEGDFLYTVTLGGSLEIYSIQNQESPSKLYDSGLSFLSSHRSIEIQGNRLFCNNYSTVYSVSIMAE